MNVKEVIEAINCDKNKAPLVSVIDIERRRKLDSTRDKVSIVAYTTRRLTFNGGDGHHGIDGIDMKHINDVIYVSLEQDGGLECVDEIVVRSMPRLAQGMTDGVI